MGIIAYFHRLTSQTLSILSDIIDASDSDDEREYEDDPHSHNAYLLNRAMSTSTGDATNEAEGAHEDEEESALGCVYVSSNDMERMGLDVWSAGDSYFVEGVVREYFGRRVKIEGRGVDVCGVRIC